MKQPLVALFSVRIIFALLLDACRAEYKPVIIIHGLFDGPKQFENLKGFITKSHPGTNVSVIDLYDNIFSLKPLWKQVEGFKNAVYPIMQSAPDGVHLVCFSQGGLVCRGLLATLDNHNVHSLILLSSPLAGQYGDTVYLKHFFPNLLKSEVYHFCYTCFGQRWSICNYWNDPHHKDRYMDTHSFLAQLNGETGHQNSTSWRDNTLRIKKMVLIGGPDDGVITPWQSSLFGFYDKNENIVGMKDQNWYVKDVFGLKTLEMRGDLKTYVHSGVMHTKWHSNFTVYKETGYKPVILVHGLLDGPKQFSSLINFITESHPGTTTTAIDLYNEESSLEPLWKQVEGFKKAIHPIMQSSPDGVHLICYSQGGMICRGLLATLDDHNVHSAIFLSAPLAGQYGGIDSKYWWSGIPKKILFLFCYTAMGQTVSICNYWNDPYHQKFYLKGNTYLALLNGDRPHGNITTWKENFLRVKKLVLIGGRDDGLITPWQSSFFSFYDAKGNLVDMRNTDWYLKDVFGLRTLDLRKDLVQCEFNGIEHTRWPHVQEVYTGCIEEWLRT